MLSDAFMSLLKIPNLLRRFLQRVPSVSICTILAEYKSQRSFDETHNLINRGPHGWFDSGGVTLLGIADSTGG